MAVDDSIELVPLDAIKKAQGKSKAIFGDKDSKPRAAWLQGYFKGWQGRGEHDAGDAVKKRDQQPVDQPDIGMAISVLQIMRPGVRADAFRDFLLSRGAWGKGGDSSFMHVSPDEIMRISAHWQPLAAELAEAKRRVGELEGYMRAIMHNTRTRNPRWDTDAPDLHAIHNTASQALSNNNGGE